MAKAARDKAEKTPVLVTTEHKGVFFGMLTGEGADLPKQIELTDARMCVSWSRTERGVLGLASAGPSRECRIGPRVNRITLYGITSVTECSPEAVAKWEKAPWNN